RPLCGAAYTGKKSARPQAHFCTNIKRNGISYNTKSRVEGNDIAENTNATKMPIISPIGL
ncbi:MAG: hypothetical protein ABJP82_11620, partial [Hyphomicrobiales bacterium]